MAPHYSHSGLLPSPIALYISIIKVARRALLELRNPSQAPCGGPPFRSAMPAFQIVGLRLVRLISVLKWNLLQRGLISPLLLCIRCCFRNVEVLEPWKDSQQTAVSDTISREYPRMKYRSGILVLITPGSPPNGSGHCCSQSLRTKAFKRLFAFHN